MATETDHYNDLHDDHDHQDYLNGSWSCPELPLNNQQTESEAVPLSGILRQESISFGKYSSESLAWEKWSVFSHNRCQEELEKFKNPGLVAQKKAYFEEYYKKIRAMKALQLEQQEIFQPDACEEAQSSKMQMEADANSIVPKEEENANSIPISDGNTTSSLNSSSGSPVEQSEQATEGQQNYANDFSVKASLKDEKSISLHKSSTSRYKTSQKNKHISSTVNQKENQPKKHIPVLQEKRTAASARNKTKMERSRIMNSAFKQSGNLNPTIQRKVSSRADNRLLTSKKIDPKAASKMNREITEVSPPATVLNALLTRDKPVSSVSSIRTRQAKTSAAPQGLAGKLPRSLPVHAESTKLMSSSPSIRAQHLKFTSSQGMARKLPTRLPVHVQSARQRSSSLNIRAQQLKRSNTCQGLAGKLPTRLPVHAQSAKSISKDITLTGGLKNMALAKRSADISTRSKSNQDIGVEIGQRSYVGVKEKEEKLKKSSALAKGLRAASASGLQNDRKSVSSIVSNSSKTSNAKLVHKCVDLTHDQREPRGYWR